MTTAIEKPTSRRERFAQCFNRLAVAFGAPVDAAKLQVYFDALGDLPLDAVIAAAEHLQREGGRFFPNTSQWHARAELERSALVNARPERIEPWKFECQVCEDTGYQERHCPSFKCARTTEHYAHTHVEPCECRPRNSTYQRRLQYQRDRARERRQAGKQNAGGE